MSDHPLRDALEKIPTNELLITGEATKEDGAAASVTFEREKGNVSGGVIASVSQRQGWGIAAFFKRVWK
jgi:hypothetical protein